MDKRPFGGREGRSKWKKNPRLENLKNGFHLNEERVLGNVVSVSTMGLRILAIRQRMQRAAGSNEEPLRELIHGCATNKQKKINLVECNE